MLLVHQHLITLSSEVVWVLTTFRLDSKIFSIFIDGLEENRASSLINLTNDTRPEGRVNN